MCKEVKMPRKMQRALEIHLNVPQQLKIIKINSILFHQLRVLIFQKMNDLCDAFSLQFIFIHEVEEFQGWGEKCWRLKECVPTGAGLCRKTGLADMLVVKLVSGADEDMELHVGSIGCIPVI